MQRRLYYGHLSLIDIIFRSPFTLPPGTDLSIVDTRHNNLYKICLVRNLYTFQFRQCLTVLFKFSSIFVILFVASLMAFLDFQSVFTSLFEAFPSCKDVQSAVGQGQKHGYNHGDFYWTWPVILFYSENQYKPQQQHSYSLPRLALLRIANTHQTVDSKLQYKHDIFEYCLQTLSSPNHRPLDTLCRANQLIGFYVMITLRFNKLSHIQQLFTGTYQQNFLLDFCEALKNNVNALRKLQFKYFFVVIVAIAIAIKSKFRMEIKIFQ